MLRIKILAPDLARRTDTCQLLLLKVNWASTVRLAVWFSLPSTYRCQVNKMLVRIRMWCLHLLKSLFSRLCSTHLAYFAATWSTFLVPFCYQIGCSLLCFLPWCCVVIFITLNSLSFSTRAGERLDPGRAPFMGRAREAIGVLNEYSKTAGWPFGIHVPCCCLFSSLLTWWAQSVSLNDSRLLHTLGAVTVLTARKYWLIQTS